MKPAVQFSMVNLCCAHFQLTMTSSQGRPPPHRGADSPGRDGRQARYVNYLGVHPRQTGGVNDRAMTPFFSLEGHVSTDSSTRRATSPPDSRLRTPTNGKCCLLVNGKRHRIGAADGQRSRPRGRNCKAVQSNEMRDVTEPRCCFRSRVLVCLVDDTTD
ncbi:hypothetical protein THAOC_26308 [Thalassiosira oceanica]|uniref:Uncharacterized protein n=1 Tax=Thalassiosira oceanica TaxID=159749 RepID=K0RLV2_THAOC|nr:hypothetical protein THAOC_26308 [Thalassiosira oceanica]|eukprot:EJK54130.1 hypothetical protein THAOC_26308 [Thalassiosira oceanica]